MVLGKDDLILIIRRSEEFYCYLFNVGAAQARILRRDSDFEAKPGTLNPKPQP